MRAEEVDSYLLALKRGERVRIRVTAEGLGSWLDSVLTLKDEQGRVLAENDDLPPGELDSPRGGEPPRADSLLDFEAIEDGDVLIEVRDRYGEGGPEYGYRLDAGEPRGDFSVELQPAERVNQARPTEAINVRPSESYSLDVVVRTEGRLGPVRLEVKGLPSGVVAEAITIRPGRTGRGSSVEKSKASVPNRAKLMLRVDPRARPDIGWLRVEGSSRLSDGTTIRRRGILNLEVGGEHVVPPNRPIVRRIDAIPISILAPKHVVDSR
ncbi:hypothetical protein [Singulisphaera sp. PoT]|uniref:hypothetical protein n=1 Tax=Singulisphaera sp. PoT TaxID=3411797 RepID=UPI003BF591DC